jgi:chromosome segregation ATPase
MSSEGSKGSDSLLNIKEVVDRNVSYATLNDLQKKGKNRFKVMKLGQFYSLIDRAVANVVERRALDMAEKDRKSIVDESNREFKRLFQERQAELNEIQRKEEELTSLREKLGRAETELQVERDRLGELERMSAEHAKGLEGRLEQEIGKIRAQAEVLQGNDTKLRQEIQQARAEVERSRTEIQHKDLELDSERQRRAALEEAVRTTRDHADTLGRDLETGIREKDGEVQRLRTEVQATREELHAEKTKVAEMDQVLRLAQERVETGSRDIEETSRARQQAESACRELEAQVREARAEATAVARRAEDFEARCTSISQEKGTLTEDTVKLREEHAGAERGRIEALERATLVETQLRTASEQLAESRARQESAQAIANERELAIADKDRQIQELLAEVARLTADRDRLFEVTQAEETDRTRVLREDLSLLANQLRSEKDQHQDTMKELLSETRAQRELFTEVRQLKEQLDAAQSAEGTALAGLSAQLGGVAPALGDIQKMLEDGVPGKPGDLDVNEQIQAAIALGMDTIKDQINLHVEGVNDKQRKQLELKAIEAAEVALDGLFLDRDEVESNASNVQVRQRESGGIGGNLAKLRALKAATAVDAPEGETE